MNKSDIDTRDFGAAVGLLTRLPIHVDTEWAAARGARAAWAYPLAGLVVGALVVACAFVLLALGASAGLCAIVALGLGIFMTGALHEDGLADTTDGLWGGWDRARRLEIMKDSRIGAYGVLALGVTLILRWQGIALLIDASAWWALMAVPAASRAVMVPLMLLRTARTDGLSRRVGAPPISAVWLAIAVGAVTLLPLGWSGAVVALVIAVTGLAIAAIARAKIGGQTGDILGASQQIAECAALIVLSAALA